MEKMLNIFANNKDGLTALGIILTFAVSTVSLYFTVRNNRAVHYVNAVTKNRVEWIYKLRELCSEYIGVVSIEHNYFVEGIKKEENTEKIAKQLTNVRILCNQIKLMLNFTDEIDRELIEIVERLKERYMTYYYEYIDFTEGKAGSDYNEEENRKAKETREDIQRLIRLLQIYLKAEWNRVKYESQGKIYEKATQEFDIKELKLKYDNPEYENDILERFKINSKVKIKRIVSSSKFILFTACIVIIVLVINISKIIQILKELIDYIFLYV